ncbi:MAG TPA: alpha-galactosidase [Bryobacteraceae bacterium]|nr:alpha-galactosidase [Bryobacteraceae bacterium]
MRRAFRFSLVLLYMAAVQHAQEVQIRSPRILIRFDQRLHKHIQWLGKEDRTIVAFDPSVQDGLRVSGVECTAYQLDAGKTSQKRVTDPEFGPAFEAVLGGTHIDTDRELRIEREIRVLLPDRCPDAVLVQNVYRNAGHRPIHLDEVYSERLLLDRKLAEPQQASYAFASFQGGAYKWGNEYAVIRLQPGFRQSNFQGVDDVTGVEGVGGGMPIVDLWSPVMGVALAHIEKVPQWISLPVAVRPDLKVEVAVTEQPQAKFRQREWLKPGDTYRTVLTAVIFHQLDFYDALRTYGALLRARGIAIPETSPPSAYQPYWKSWGYQRDFTLQQFLDKLPELESMGIHMANLDDGWQNNNGDWEPNRAPGKCPNGAPDMVQFVREVHRRGFRIGLWWYPFGVSPESKIAKERPELLVQAEDGSYPLDINGYYQLCPAYEPALNRVRELVLRTVKDWDFDGLYSDFQGLSAVPACFNSAHHHQSPLDSFQAVPKVFETIAKTLHELKKDPYNEVCICSLPHSPYNMPFYDIANASDPLTPWQVRSRIKVEKAIRGGTFAVGDCYQVPIHEWYGSSVPESFESAIGTGGQLTTFYVNLDERQKALWNRWFHEYPQLGLSHSEYINLYDLAFDKPEGHVVRKGSEMYYGFFADYWPRTTAIELRGLDNAQTYEVYDYGNRRMLGQIRGSAPRINVGFKDNLLLRVRPAGSGTPAP